MELSSLQPTADAKLRILVVEDFDCDAELMMLRLHDEGFRFEWERVQTEPEYLAALTKQPDLILADWRLPQFSGMRALNILREQGLEIPFIIVSGGVGEESAIDAVHQGAADYVLKDRPARLGTAVRRALEQKILRDERRLAEDILRESEVRFRTMANNGRALIWTAGLDKLCNYFNQPWLDFTGRSLEQELGNGWTEGVHAEDFDRCLETYVAAFDRQDKFSMVYRLRRHDGAYRWILDEGTPRYDHEERFIGYIGHCMDITEVKQAEEELRLADRVFRSSGEGIMVTDADANIIAINPAFTDITGYSKEDAYGQNPRFLHSGRQEENFYREMWSSLLGCGQWRGELWNRKKNGEIYPEWLTLTAVRDEEGHISHFVGVFSDISSVKDAQQQIDFLAHHDPLTSLPNRSLFHDRLSHGLERAHRDMRPLALLFLDLDRFKNVNDTLGHPVGDQLLRAATERMAGELRSGDTLARLGGDEFLLLLEDDADSHATAAVARKLLELFAKPFNICGHELVVTASIGISLFPGDGEDADTLLKNADRAMYEAKSRGRNTFQFFEPALSAGVLERLMMENALRGATARRELLLHYQPQLDLASGDLVGVEALVRWQHPDLGLVSPAQFIPLAEEMGIIGELGAWVLQEACRQMIDWQAQGFHVPRVAVNLSVQQIERETLLSQVSNALAGVGLAAQRLELEVTESMIMHKPELAQAVLAGLMKLGVQLAVDDFGTGYSSLAYLKRLSLHRLKIDQSFVRDIGRDTNNESIIRAVIALARSLGLETIAEGVEQVEQADFLIREGCSVGQGYLYSRPVPAEELLATYHCMT